MFPVPVVDRVHWDTSAGLWSLILVPVIVSGVKDPQNRSNQRR